MELGGCIPTLFVAATDGPRNNPSSFGFTCIMEWGDLQISHHEIGRASLFCRLLLPLSDIAHIRYHNLELRQKAMINLQILFRRAKLDARFSPYPILNPSVEKNPKKTSLRTFPDALSFRPLYSVLLLRSRTHPGPL